MRNSGHAPRGGGSVSGGGDDQVGAPLREPTAGAPQKSVSGGGGDQVGAPHPRTPGWFSASRFEHDAPVERPLCSQGSFFDVVVFMVAFLIDHIFTHAHDDTIFITDGAVILNLGEFGIGYASPTSRRRCPPQAKGRSCRTAAEDERRHGGHLGGCFGPGLQADGGEQVQQFGLCFRNGFGEEQ